MVVVEEQVRKSSRVAQHQHPEEGPTVHKRCSRDRQDAELKAMQQR